MKKLISELRELMDNKHRSKGMSNYAYADFDEKLTEMEAKITKEPTPKKSVKFVELTSNGYTTLIKRKSICLVNFKNTPFDEVYILLKNGENGTHTVSENEEVLENLIADFKG